jgi:hypothetical protein
VSAPWFEIAQDGHAVAGPVQGAGGMVPTLERLEGAQRLARQGRPHGLHEPRPGCVAVYPEYSARGNGRAVVVSLVGASVAYAETEVDWSDAALSEYAGEEFVGGMTKAERESVAAWAAFCFARVLYGYAATEEEEEHLPTCPVPFRPCDCGDAEDDR